MANMNDTTTKTESEREMKAYSTFRLLRWIQAHTNETPGTTEKKAHSKLEATLHDLKSRYPHFRDSEHPDFLMWAGTTQAIQPVSPLKVGKLIEWIDSDIAKVFDLLSSTPDMSLIPDFQYNAKQLFKELVAADKKAALVLLEALADSTSYTLSAHRRFMAIEAILEAFGKVVLDQDEFCRFRQCMRVLPDVLATGDLQKALDLSAAAIKAQIVEADNDLASDFHNDMKDTAAELWDTVMSHPFGPTATDRIWPPMRDPLMDAINHAAGMITEFWLKSVAVEWRHNLPTWSGLPQDTRIRLEEMLSSPLKARSLVEAILVTRLQFLNRADPEWTGKHVLPLLDFEAALPADSQPDDAPSSFDDIPQDERAWCCWSAYLTWGKTTNELLEAGLDRMYLDITRRIWNEHPDWQPGTTNTAPLDWRSETVNTSPFDPQTLDKSIDGLRTHLADICVYSDQLIRKPGWILDLTSVLSVKGRLWFIRAIGSTLNELDDKATQETWNRWLEQYWQHRLDGIPDRLDRVESSAFAELTPYLKSHASDGIRMSLHSSAGLLPNSRLPYLLSQSPLVGEIPEKVAQLLSHLCANTKPETMKRDPFFVFTLLRQLVARLRGNTDREHLENIVEQAMRLGCEQAQTWLLEPST